MLKSWLWVAALGLVAGLPRQNAHADEAYICDGGRLVYANAETLERLKQTDPCIAQYYLQDSTRQDATPAAQTAPPLTLPAARTKAPLLKPAMRDAGVKSKSPKVAQQAKPAAVPGETRLSPNAGNVRVINAAPGSAVPVRHQP